MAPGHQVGDVNSACVGNNAQGAALLTSARSSPKRGESRCHHLSARKSRHDGAAYSSHHCNSRRCSDRRFSSRRITRRDARRFEDRSARAVSRRPPSSPSMYEVSVRAWRRRGSRDRTPVWWVAAESTSIVGALKRPMQTAVFQATNRTDSAAPDSRGPTTYRVRGYTLRNSRLLAQPAAWARTLNTTWSF